MNKLGFIAKNWVNQSWDTSITEVVKKKKDQKLQT